MLPEGADVCICLDLDEVPDLHDLYGKPFKAAYEAYEAKAAL